MIDTHTHIYGPEFDIENQAPGSFTGQADTVDRAVAAGVSLMVLPAVDRSSIVPMKALHALRPDATALAVGLHPTEVKEGWREELEYMHSLLTDGSHYVAVGEVGVDLYWDATFREAQMQAFAAQLEWARQLSLPIIIHQRSALEPTLEVLGDYTDVPAVFHSFGGSVADVERIRRLGDYYFGINGIVTFKNSGLKSVIPAIGIDRILTETDAPYLAPVPYRGRRNESSYTPYVLATVADALGVDTADADATTTNNARRFFKI